MKNMFRGHYEPTSKELEKLWKECIFVVDTNILLNLYEYSPKTSFEIIKIFKENSERFWLPHQVALEYFSKRIDIIARQGNEYNNVIKNIKETKADLAKKLLSNTHPFIEDDSNLIQELKEIFDKIIKKLENQKNEYLSLTEKNKFRDELAEIFKGKVGDPYSDEQLEKIYNIGKKRYEREIPPGYKDRNKDKGNENSIRKYGDLILWFQIIDKSKKEKNPIILIINEKKEDWWQKSGDKIIGPHPLLRQEMFKETNMFFYMYRLEPFLKNAKKYLQQTIGDEIIDEVRKVNKKLSDEKTLHDLATKYKMLQGEIGLLSKMAIDENLERLKNFQKQNLWSCVSALDTLEALTTNTTNVKTSSFTRSGSVCSYADKQSWTDQTPGTNIPDDTPNYKSTDWGIVEPDDKK